jgi:hypothetical protein
MNRKRGLEESHCSSQPQKIQIIYPARTNELLINSASTTLSQNGNRSPVR